MLKLCRVTKVKVFFLVLGYVFNFDLFEFSAAILEKGLLKKGVTRQLTETWKRRPRILNYVHVSIHDRPSPLFHSKRNITVVCLKAHTISGDLKKKGSFTLKIKRVKCFPSALCRRNLKTQQSPGIVDLCLKKTWTRKSQDYQYYIVVEKRAHKIENLVCSNAFG